MAELIHSWQSLTGGHSDITLEPGTYRFTGSAMVKVQLIMEHIPEGEPVWLTSDDAGPTRNPARISLGAPLNLLPLIVTETGEFRVKRGPGHLNLTRV